MKKKSDSNGLKPMQKFSLRSLRVFMALFAVAVFFSCSSPEQNETQLVLEVKDSVQLSSERVIQKDDFTSVLKGITISNIHQYLNPEKGLWLVQSSGAMPNMSNTTQVDRNFPVDFTTCKTEELPKVNCDSKSFWTKDGCFVQELNSFKDEKIWAYCGLSKEDELKAEETAKTITYTVINTSMNARYYFSQIDGKWYLTFVDLRRPCEA